MSDVQVGDAWHDLQKPFGAASRVCKARHLGTFLQRQEASGGGRVMSAGASRYGARVERRLRRSRVISGHRTVESDVRFKGPKSDMRSGHRFAPFTAKRHA